MGQTRDNGHTPGAAQRVCACGTRLSASNTGTRCAVCERKFAEGVTEPPVMPRDFWYTDRFHEAFESRNMGKVLRAFRTDERHQETYGPGGIRQAWLASWLGITQVQVSRLERGESLTDSHDKMIQWAQILSIPPELLWFDLPGQQRQKLPRPKPASRAKKPAKNTKRIELIAARKAAGLTQEQLAERMVVDRKSVVRWEAGERVPQPYLQPKLGKILGVSPERLAEILAVPPERVENSTLLRELLRRRHLQTYRAFCQTYDKAAMTLDKKLVGTYPAERQFTGGSPAA